MQQTEYLTNQSDTVALIQEDSVLETMPLGIQIVDTDYITRYWSFDPGCTPWGSLRVQQSPCPFASDRRRGSSLMWGQWTVVAGFFKWGVPEIIQTRPFSYWNPWFGDPTRLEKPLYMNELPIYRYLLKMVIFPMWNNQRLIHSIPFRHICLTTHPQVVHQSEVCWSPSISASFGVNPPFLEWKTQFLPHPFGKPYFRYFSC